MKVKHFWVWSLMLALVSLGIGPELAIAAKKTYDSPSLTEAYTESNKKEKDQSEKILIGAGIVVGVILIGSLIWWGVSRNKTETASSKDTEPKDKRVMVAESRPQEKDSKTSTNTHDNLFDSSGDLVVFAW